MLVVVLGGMAAAAFAADAQRADSAGTAELIARGTNAFRAANGLGTLAVNRRLADAAQRFAEYMAGSDQYGHEADGHRPADRASAQGYEYCMIAENIAFQFSSLGFGSNELAGRLVQEWEQSPGHRRNMLSPQVMDIGIGVAQSARTQRYYAVQLFGRPRSAAARFELANRSDAAIRYEIDDQGYTLPPGVTRTHQGCFNGPLKIDWPDGPTSPGFAPLPGARYVVQRDQSGHLRLQAVQP